MPEDIAENRQQKQDSIEGNGESSGGNQTNIHVGDIHAEEGSQVNIAGGDINIFQRISNFFRADTELLRAMRNRQNMLKLVWNTWIEGVLKKSLHNEILIELGMEVRPDVVEHPWDMVVQQADREPKTVAPGTKMIDLLEQSNESLLIYGAPGSGKTTMLLELARQCIKRAEQDPIQPIPVYFNLSSWDPSQTISEWLIDELKDKYYISMKIGRSWIEQDELLLLLDGLDEVNSEYRHKSVQAINIFQDKHASKLVVCSRKQEYDELKIQFKLHNAVLIQRMTSKVVQEYLQKVNTKLWEVFLAIDQDANNRNAVEEREFLRTPLFLSIMVLTFMNAKMEDLEKLGRTKEYPQRLFNAYVVMMLNRRGAKQSYAQAQTKEWLGWLARAMIHHKQTQIYIEDIQPSWTGFSEMKLRFIFGFSFGAIWGLSFGLLYGVLDGVIYGIIAALIGMLIMSDHKPTDKLTFSWIQFRKELVNGLKSLILVSIGGLIYGLIIGSIAIGLITGLLLGIIIGFFIGLSGGLIGATVETRGYVGEGIQASWKNALFSFLFIGLIAGLVGMLIGGAMVGLRSFWLLGLLAGMTRGLIFLIAHYLARFLLYQSGNLPWKLVDFLDYADERIFLRKAGGSYVFIHRMLMEHFAEMDEQR
jgi:Cdc6-like AAA superfamily ATPase